MSNQQDQTRKLTGGIKDDLEGGTTGATSMTDGDSGQQASGQLAGGGEERLGGRQGGPAEPDLGPIGLGTANGSPARPSGGEQTGGPAGNGSFASGTYNDRGNVTGPDSPAGRDFMLQQRGDTEGQGQGDDLANRLGGGEGRGAGMAGGGAATGALDADRSAPDPESALGSAGAGAPGGGDPGGMGGVHAQGGTGAGRPPGGVSPVGSSRDGGSGGG